MMDMHTEGDIKPNRTKIGEWLWLSLGRINPSRSLRHFRSDVSSWTRGIVEEYVPCGANRQSTHQRYPRVQVCLVRTEVLFIYLSVQMTLTGILYQDVHWVDSLHNWLILMANDEQCEPCCFCFDTFFLFCVIWEYWQFVFQRECKRTVCKTEQRYLKPLIFVKIGAGNREWFSL